MEVSSFSARLRYSEDMVAREGSVAVKQGSGLFCVLVVVSGGCRGSELGAPRYTIKMQGSKREREVAKV